MSMTDMISGDVKQFAYRTANVTDVFLRVPRDTVRSLEVQLADKAGVGIDNHTVYEIIQSSRPPVYILFSDFHATFGQSIEERRW